MKKLDEFVSYITLNCSTKYITEFNQFWLEQEQLRINNIIKCYLEIIFKLINSRKLKIEYRGILLNEIKDFDKNIGKCNKEEYDEINLLKVQYSDRLLDLDKEIKIINNNISSINSIIQHERDNYKKLSGCNKDKVSRAKTECAKFLRELNEIICLISRDKIDEFIDLIKDNLLLGLNLVHSIYCLENSLLHIEDCNDEIKPLVEKYYINNLNIRLSYTK